MKWQRELRHRFGVEVIDTDAKGALGILKGAVGSGPNYSFAVVASMQGLRPLKGWDQDNPDDDRGQTHLARFLQEQQYGSPLIDLLIIDEAHYLRNPDLKKKKKTSILGQLMRNVSDSIVLLSATPVHLRSQDLYQLLNIVDEALFNQPRVFDQILMANAPLVKARDTILARKVTTLEFLELMRPAQAHPLLSDNKQLSSLINTPPGEKELSEPSSRIEIAHQIESINLFGHVITRTRRREVSEYRVLRTAYAYKIKLSEPEYNFYTKVTAYNWRIVPAPFETRRLFVGNTSKTNV